jgi:cellulose synthase/poly-beta-1,6-N-acetylglucosamine synthase-like glycosyltransferase
MACRGNEPRLREIIEAILNQAYPNYRTIIVTDTVHDPAYSIARSALNRHPTIDAHLYTSDPHPNASGKVTALLTALERDGWASDAYAFLDSDAFTTLRWLKDIIEPLHEPSVGATTGFRWYFPVGGFWSHVESAWNASGTNLMFNERYNFPWGGAMAILTQTMKEINVRGVWEKAISDDLSLNAALRNHNCRTVFLPQCTVATYNQATMQSFLKWATRQVALTKAFNRRLWNYGSAAYAFFAAVLTLGIVSLIAGLISSKVWLLPAVLLFAPSILGVFRSNERITTFKSAMPEFAADFDRNRWGDSIASLIVPWVMTYCIFRSARMREIEWRGRRYKLNGQTTLAST